ncbi:MAG TPA: protein-tyrosine phosphatase family protein [Blastocatellia bacterium]|nr:protein-tyrosine phosphatase family protein [Blastocatellia bacterium]
MDIYWLENNLGIKLATATRPRGNDWLEDDIHSARAAGVGVMVSLLEEPEALELGLSMEAHICKQENIEFIPFPIPDYGVPASLARVQELAERLYRKGLAGSIAVHCRQGVGRSSLIAACVLVRAGMNPDAAFEAIRKARGVSVPDTTSQTEWVSRFADFTSAKVRL